MKDFRVLLYLLISWVIAFLINEKYVPYRTIRKCKWPKLNQGDNVMKQQTNILLIADPQLIDNHTYPGRNPYLLSLSQHTVDQHLKRNYAQLTKLNPNSTIFLGDLLDNGRASTDEYFAQELARFRSIYPKTPKMYTNLPGNHDIGFGDLIRTDIRDRFGETFGNPNLQTSINGVEFILVDTTSLSSTKDSINQAARGFVNGLPKKGMPRILLSHVPLFRDPNTNCGPLREKPKFESLGRGYQYQNSLTKEISNQLLEKIEPDLIFSGDDHDYCDIVHPQGTREITVKSVSMAMGIYYPAVQLLSYSKSPEGLKYQTKICYMQTPYINVVVYIVLAIISIVVILQQNLRLKTGNSSWTILPLSRSKREEKSKMGTGGWRKQMFLDVVKEGLAMAVVVILVYKYFIAI
ncbi:planktonic growth-induced gene [Candida orthopsilosis Co 90-125]|uniref:Planktonic growth-induced protein n=1 Tax=Candida orthopsilosis (strain 90-125) TaxID=1136231 RepID=H8X914_CANO9|nr:planktonic growth-induced gene [Candida orthopsilosis Co 90-125]CCG24312.1 planktonic growth-induced gene [Candida orthopsilosis Co 90-125]